MKFLLAALMALVLHFHAIPAPAESDHASDVEKALAGYRQAWLDGDEARVLGALSEEIQLFVPGETGGKLDGKPAVREFWFPASDRRYPIRKYEISDQEIYVHGDLAIVTGRSRLDWDTVEGGAVIDSASSRSEYLTVLRNENGRWRIFRQIYQMR